MESKNLVEIPLKLPGKLYRSPMPFARFDLKQTTFDEMLNAEISTVVMLIEENEDQYYTGKDLKEEYSRQNIDVIHYPIKDFDTPEDSSQLRSQLEDVIGRINAGEKVAVHCFAGRGRTGLFIALLSRIALDLGGDESIIFVREYFKAIETPLQEQMVRDFVPNKNEYPD